MGVSLTIAVILASAAVGSSAERRWPERTGMLARRGMVLALYTVLPVVVFFNIAHLEFDFDVGLGLALGLGINATAGFLAYLIGSRLLGLTRPQTGALIVITIVSNTGYLGYPLNASLLGHDALSEAVAWDVLVSGPSLLLGAFAVGAAFGEKAGETVSERIRAYFTRNPPLFAAVAALIAPQSLAPDLAVDISRVLVIALLPLGFFVVGATLAEQAQEGRVRFALPSMAVLTGISLRMLLAPGLLFLLALPLIDLPGPYQLQAAMPCGINGVLVAHVYGLDLRLVAHGVAWATVVAIAALAVSFAFV